MALSMGQLPDWARANQQAINIFNDGMFQANQTGPGSSTIGNGDGTGVYSGLPEHLFDSFGEGIDRTTRINMDRLQEFLGSRQLMEASGPNDRGARWLQDASGAVVGPVDEYSTAPDKRFALAALLAGGAVGAGVAGMGAAAGSAGSAASTTAGSGLTAGTGGSGLAMGGGTAGSIGGSGLTAGGTAATGLTAAPGAGLTLAAPTGTGAGIAAGTGAGTIGAGIGASLPAVGQSVISPSIAAQAATSGASAGRAPSAAAQAPTPASRLAEALGMSPQALRLLMGGIGALAGATQGTGGGGAAAAPAGPPVQWNTGLQMGIQPTQQRRATPSAVRASPGGAGAGRFFSGLRMG